MPAVGLPTALEGTLEALLKENAVCSWKICAEGTKTTVVLRLASISDSDRPAMTRHFRRKPPSQLQRDRLRAQERQEKKEKGNQNEPKASQNCSSSMSNLSISSRPQMTQQQPVGCDVDTQHSSSDNFARVAGTADKPTERGNNSQGEAGVVLLSPRTAEPRDVFVLTTQSQRGSTETRDISEQRALDFGYSLPSIKKYVSELRDRSAVRSVKNVHRNNSFRRVVRDNTGDRQSLLCETDDFVLIKDCSSDDLTGTYWMIKQATRHMLPEEQGYLDNLRHGSPVDRGKFKDSLRTVLHEVSVLRNVTRFYLG